MPFRCVLGSALALLLPIAAPGQQLGANSIVQDANATRLALSETQRADIDKIVKTTRAKVQALMRRARAGDGNRQELRREAREARRAALAAAVALLNDKQKKTWDEIAAAPPARGARRPPSGDRSSGDRAPRDLGPADIVRVSSEARRGRGPGLRVPKTTAHPVAETGYVVLTDHVDPVALEALQKLAKHRGGRVLRIGDLAALAKDAKAREAVQTTLRADLPRFVAVAPRPESYRENTVLAIWEVLSRLDADPQLDAFPGFLVARTTKGLAALVDRSIAFRPTTKAQFRAFALAEVPPDLLYKSYESSGLLKKLFAARGVTMRDVTIAASDAIRAREDFPKITGEGRFEIRKKQRRDLLKAFPTEVAKEIEAATFLWILGHGKPGMACCAEVSAYTKLNLENKIVFCGACFATSAPESDLIIPRGTAVREKPRFALEAIEDGCVIVIGNMAFSRGVHFLLPIFEHCLEGMSVGESYQRLVNAHLGAKGIVDPYVSTPVRGGPSAMDRKARRANQLVNVLIGDPALRPFGGLR